MFGKDKFNPMFLIVFEEKDFKWLDPASGMVNYPIAIYYKLLEGLHEQIPDREERNLGNRG